MPKKPADKRKNHGLRALLANTGCGSILVAAPGDIHIMNEGAQEMLGLNREEVVGRPMSLLQVPELVSAIDEALTTEGSCDSRWLSLNVNGKALTCRIACYAGEECEHGVVVSLRDDTELVRQQERAEAILASTGDGLIVFAPDNRITYVNPAACELLGTELEEVLNKRTTTTVLLGLQPPDPSEAASCWDMRSCDQEECPAWHGEDLRCWLVSGTLCQGEPMSFMDKMSFCYSCDVYLRDSRLLEESGMQHTREMTLSDPHRVLMIKTNPVIDAGGDYIGCVKILRDVTAEHEVSEMKNEFVSTVSHELRTPLTSIKGYVDLILDGETGEINDIQREFLAIVKQNSDRLVELINDMLDISRIESGRIHLKVEPIDIADSIAGAVDTFRALLEQTHQELTVDITKSLPQAAGDRDRVGQVLTNLVSNAIKYSPGGGSIGVSARKRDHQVVVSVKDTGIGISTKDQEHLFDKFYRVDSSLTREIGGTGLGLSICKTIIELLGGQIWVESVPGKGSTFSFSLPVAPKELVRTPEVESPEMPRGGTVLVVDKSREIANLIEIYLRKQGYDVIKAHSADEAMRTAIAERPSVITLDVMLEGVDGFDFLQQLKEHPETSSIPVVILSIVCDEGKSCRLGAANYLEKPIDQERLIAIVDDLIGTIAAPCVLVVDDDKHIVELLSRNLKSRGFAVVPAYNGLEAMAAIQHKIPDLILLDLRMPEMDGYQVIEQVKKSDATKHVPIVVMTAYHFDREKTDILNLAAGQVAKPFKPAQLAAKVASILEAEWEQQA